MRLRTLIVGLVGLLAIGLVVPLVLMNVGGSHATKGSGNRAGGCTVPAAGVVSLGAYAPGWISRDCVLHGPSLVHAAVTDTRAEAVDLVYADGRRQRLRLVRVGRPINASFFLYELPRDRLAP